MSGNDRRLPEIVLLVAAERSGTHLLRSILNKAESIAAPGELCNAAAYEQKSDPLSFFRFRHEFTKAGATWNPTARNQDLLLASYFDFIKSSFRGRDWVVCDIKYSHVHNFNDFWWDFSHRPFLLSFARTRKIRVIHLVRRKVYQTAVSNFYAQESGVWRAESAGELRSISISIDLQKLRKAAFHLSRAISLFTEWLEGSRTVTIGYEDLAEKPDMALKQIADFLGLAGKLAYSPGYLKTTPPYESALSNFSEVAHLLDLDFSDTSSEPA